MQIDGKNVAGAGTTALGIIGTTLGGLAVAGMANSGEGNGLFGNLFGGNCNTNEDLEKCRDEVAMLKSERYTDAVGAQLFERIVNYSNVGDMKMNANYKELAQAIAQLDKNVALNKQAGEFQYAILNNKIDCDYDKAISYVNGHFVPGTLKLTRRDICGGYLTEGSAA